MLRGGRKEGEGEEGGRVKGRKEGRSKGGRGGKRVNGAGSPAMAPRLSLPSEQSSRRTI